MGLRIVILSITSTHYESYFLAPGIPKFFLSHLNDLRQGSYLTYINGGKQHAHLNLKVTFLTFKMKHE